MPFTSAETFSLAPPPPPPIRWILVFFFFSANGLQHCKEECPKLTSSQLRRNGYSPRALSWARIARFPPPLSFARVLPPPKRARHLHWPPICSLLVLSFMMFNRLCLLSSLGGCCEFPPHCVSGAMFFLPFLSTHFPSLCRPNLDSNFSSSSACSVPFSLRAERAFVTRHHDGLFLFWSLAPRTCEVPVFLWCRSFFPLAIGTVPQLFPPMAFFYYIFLHVCLTVWSLLFWLWLQTHFFLAPLTVGIFYPLFFRSRLLFLVRPSPSPFDTRPWLYFETFLMIRLPSLLQFSFNFSFRSPPRRFRGPHPSLYL